jgi:hypothetical protein
VLPGPELRQLNKDKNKENRITAATFIGLDFMSVFSLLGTFVSSSV